MGEWLRYYAFMRILGPRGAMADGILSELSSFQFVVQASRIKTFARVLTQTEVFI